MPWQRYVADVALEIDEKTGRPVYHTVVLVVMRQQGKTELLLPVMTHRAVGFADFGAQTILYTTQTRAEARKKWEDIHIKRLESSPFAALFTKRLRINHEAMLFVNGSIWSPAAGTAKTGGTGDSVDFASIDEAWSAEARRELGLRPAMMTRKSRQLWITSMVPGLSRAATTDSAYLKSKMAIGRSMCRDDIRKGIAYFEFGAPKGADPSDPATWLACMPAVCPDLTCTCDPEGIWRHTVNVGTIQEDFQSFDLVDFCAEYLSWWPTDDRPQWTVVKEATWNRLKDPSSQPGRMVYAGIDMDETRDQAFIAITSKRPDGKWHDEIIEPGQSVPSDVTGLDWVVPTMVEVCEENDIGAVAIDPRGPAQSLILPLQNKGITVLTPNTLEISAACGRWYDSTGQAAPKPETEMAHLDDPVYNKAVAVAHKVVSNKNRTFTWDRLDESENAESIAPLWAVTLARHAAEVHALDDYDVRDSVLGADGECADCGMYPLYPGGPIQHYDDCELFPPSASKGDGEQ